VQPGVEPQKLAGGELLVNERAIRDETERGFRQLRLGGPIVVIPDDTTRGWLQQPGDHSQRRRLAGAIGTEKAMNLAGLNVERHAIARGKPAVLLYEMLDRNHGVFLWELNERGFSQRLNQQQSAV